MTRRGFTLLEVLISIVIMTIAFFAVLATEVSSIQGYTSARDASRAAELGKVVTEYLQVESNGWRDAGPIPTTLAAWGTTAGDDAPLDAGLSALAASPWDWVVMTLDPVDERLARGTNVTNGKFCAYGRGGYLPMDISTLNQVNATTGALQSAPLFQAQVAVVYSAPTADPLLTCPTADDMKVLLIPNNPTALETLELKGLRVTFFGTVIQRKDW